ncbi:crotonase/enoyl-CoA hydratase family protein [Nocardioidaceae bacterium]|nr:crotonase/enoyl-CoA hydratase family protein [Nocardioidaceae bacterium]
MADLRTRLSRAASTARTLAPVLARTARDTAEDLVGRVRPPAADDGGATVEVPEPSGTEDFARRVHAVREVPGSVEDTVALVCDLDRWHEWLTLHLSWRGERPSTLSAETTGEQFTQQISLMDIPAQARWTVARVGTGDHAGFELRGTGPMGITVGLWATVVPAGSGAAVRLDGALDGPPVRGPVGLTALRSVETAARESLDLLAGLLGGGASARIADEPVRHEATGRMLDPSTPVVVGVGQAVRRPGQDDPVEPIVLAERALRAAAADAAPAAVDADALLGRADAVYAVPSASWTYADQAGLTAARVGAFDVGSDEESRPETVQTSPYGGDGGQLALNDAAQQIVDGRAHVVLVSGAEAGAAIAAIQAEGRDPDWTQGSPDGATGPDRVIGVDKQANNEAETSVGLGAPIYMYALMESALRRASGLSAAEHTSRIAGLWSRLARTATVNPYAWDRSGHTPGEIAAPTADNRMVSEPYTKLMCANLQVDLGAGVILTSVAAAQALGIDQSRWVFLHAGASAVDEWFVSERASLTESPAIAAAGAAALAHAGVTAQDLGPVDLYSCFPSAVQIGAAALGLPIDDPDRPLSVTGGLTFAGGPGNAYGLHGVATMVPMLRHRPEEFGLTTSLGWYATKHALGVWSASPPEKAYANLHPMVDRPAPRPVSVDPDVLDQEGSVVEAVTVAHARDGSVEGAIVSVITADGTRVLLRRETAKGIEPGERTLPAPPEPPLRVTRAGADGEIAILTLNRPAKRNAVDRRMALMLERAVDDAEADASVRVIVLTGMGDHFCAGMDLSGANRGEVPVTDRRGPLGLAAEPPTKPTIAAVEGSALAGGFELVLCADLVVAGETATFGLPEAKRGLLAAAGGLLRTSLRLPRPVALELAMTGDPLPASRLHDLGLVNRVVDDGAALDAALELAATVAANAPLSVRVGKQIVDEAPGWVSLDDEEAFEKQSQMASPVILSDDAKEGVAACAEKRQPTWTGR